MSALIALLVIAGWALLGFMLWRRLIKPYVPSTLIRICLTIILAAVWFIGPVLDEILGAKEFDQLCREMPSIKFYGPVAVGPGDFFNEQGRPKWKNNDEFWKIEHNSGGTYNVISNKSDWRSIHKLPMPIVEKHSVYFEKATGALVLESFALYSAGGWLRQLIGIGDYQCPSKGRFPSNEELIVFKARH